MAKLIPAPKNATAIDNFFIILFFNFNNSLTLENILPYFLNKSLPSGFIPNEDQGMFYAVIQTPPGSTLERTNQVAEKLQKNISSRHA